MAGLRSPPWQSTYGGIAPEVLFSPLGASLQQQLQSSILRGSLNPAVADKTKGKTGGQTPTVHEQLELVPPSEWVQDEDAPTCQGEGCGATFGFFLRRHHCRACGGIFCYACSSHTLRLAQGPSRVARRRRLPAAAAAVKHRVCDECYAVATSHCQ